MKHKWFISLSFRFILLDFASFRSLVRPDLPLYTMYTLKYEDSLITDADKHALQPWNSLDLKIGR